MIIRALAAAFVAATVLSICGNAQAAHPKTFSPQVYFDRHQAKSALGPGNSSINGVAFAIDPMDGRKSFSNEGTLVLLLPYTDYLHEWLNLTNKNKNTNNSVYLFPGAFEVRREVATNRNGEFSFKNLKPGKYYVESIIGYQATALGKDHTANINSYQSDRYGNVYGNSTPVYEYYSYRYAAAERAFKVVEIKSNGDMINLNLKPTPPVPFVDLDALSARTNGIKCYLQQEMMFGTCIYYHPDGKIKTIAEWKNNKYNGKFKEYYENGTLMAEGAYANGDKDKHWKYYAEEDGALKQAETYKSGNGKSVLHGEVNFYFPNGGLRQKDTYRNGVMDGISVVYHQNGQLKDTVTFRNGELYGTSSHYSETGELIEQCTYPGGKAVCS